MTEIFYNSASVTMVAPNHGILQARILPSGLPLLSSGDLPNPEIEPGSPAMQADSLPSEPPPNTHSYSY